MEPKLVEHIKSRDDLVLFIQKLAESLVEKPEEWQNIDLQSYILAIAAWIKDMDGYFMNIGEPMPEVPNWKTIGQILLAAKYYE
jgi:hypothetical protein